MSDQTNRIIDKKFKDEKFIEAYISYFESLKENIQRSEKFRQRNVNENKDSTIQ